MTIEEYLMNGHYTLDSPEKKYPEVKERINLRFDERGYVVGGNAYDAKTGAETGEILKGIRVNTGHDISIEFVKRTYNPKEDVHYYLRKAGRIDVREGLHKGYWRYEFEPESTKRTRARMVMMEVVRIRSKK